MKHQETCLCAKHTLEFTSEFQGDVVTKIYCPHCVDRAPDDAIVFELCEPGELAGVWGVLYNRGELERLDRAFRDADDYYLSLLISGVCGPSVIKTHYRGGGGICRIFGFKSQGPDRTASESSLSGHQHAIADDEAGTRWPGDVYAGPKEGAGKGKRHRKGGGGRSAGKGRKKK
jgi:hypothetical protein